MHCLHVETQTGETAAGAEGEQVLEVNRCTSDGCRGRVVLGEGETAAGQDVFFLQVPEFQDVDLTFDCRRSTFLDS